MLHQSLKALTATVATCLMAASFSAQADEVKVGMLSQFSGVYAWWGKDFQRGVDLYLAQNGNKVGEHTITVLPRDEAGTNPQRSRQLAQELVVRDQVQYLMGGTFTPTVLGVTEVATQTKTPFIIFNSGTSNVTDKSPYFARIGFTQWTVSVPLVEYAISLGAKSAAIVSADFAPGADASEAYGKTFAKMGGTIAADIKIPLGTTDFSSYLQRVRDAKVPYVFVFMPLGPMSVGFVKAFKERELDKAGITMFATTETMEPDLPSIGDAALGMITAQHYSPYIDTPTNKAFVAAYTAKFGKTELPTIASLTAYDGMRVVAEMIKATNGKKDGDKAMASLKGFKWDSPRGPVSIDPNTREIIQNVYIRKVEKVGGMLGNVPFKTYPAVKDPWHELQPKS